MTESDYKFNAFIIRKDKDIFVSKVEQFDLQFLKKNDILIKVEFSALNFKDCLSINGNPGVTRRYPHIPGTDAAGVVVRSDSPLFKVGDKVIVVASEMGQNTFGGFSQYISVKADWLIKLPEKLSVYECMQIGTAGFTAGLAVYEIISHCALNKMQPILVTGASGGVGSISILILKKLGYTVYAATSNINKKKYLENLGVDRVLTNEKLLENTNMNLCKKEWQGVIDTIGGEIMSACIKKTYERGVIISVGNIKSDQINLNILPFILRGVRLIGVSAENQSYSSKMNIWNKIANSWKFDFNLLNTKCITLNEICKYSELMFKGDIEGRVVIKVNNF